MRGDPWSAVDLGADQASRFLNVQVSPSLSWVSKSVVRRMSPRTGAASAVGLLARRGWRGRPSDEPGRSECSSMSTGSSPIAGARKAAGLDSPRDSAGVRAVRRGIHSELGPAPREIAAHPAPSCAASTLRERSEASRSGLTSGNRVLPAVRTQHMNGSLPPEERDRCRRRAPARDRPSPSHRTNSASCSRARGARRADAGLRQRDRDRAGHPQRHVECDPLQLRQPPRRGDPGRW